jgi:hypothetical protein
MPKFFSQNEVLVQNADFTFWASKSVIEGQIAAFVSIKHHMLYFIT